MVQGTTTEHLKARNIFNFWSDKVKTGAFQCKVNYYRQQNKTQSTMSENLMENVCKT